MLFVCRNAERRSSVELVVFAQQTDGSCLKRTGFRVDSSPQLRTERREIVT